MFLLIVIVKPKRPRKVSGQVSLYRISFMIVVGLREVMWKASVKKSRDFVCRLTQILISTQAPSSLTDSYNDPFPISLDSHEARTSI